MRLSGSFELPASRSRVWQSLLDPKTLQRCLPGCERMEPLGDDRYRTVLTVKVAGIQSAYQAEIELQDQRPREHFQLRVFGKGPGGFVNGSGSIELTEKTDQTEGTEKTELRYSGDLQVGGLLASVGSRLLDSAAKKVLREFLEKLAQEVSADS
ncbi:MAG: carbon monoxide dehydrogenase subunit G [Acidobacteria bacterium]|nr:carbon monoxide dehydrogenase subunit G [Acidobacteriota bacterium]